jgi:His/Glu/Gln/Arg/opine family amino acid ABC transporter permease subunit
MDVLGITISWDQIWENRDPLLDGLLVAIEVSAVALVLSVALGLLLALMRLSSPPLTWIGAAYVNIFRGVPALVSVLWVYFGLSLAFGVQFTTFQAGTIALTLLYSAFIAEIYRAALEAIPGGQREAGLALGMHPVRVFASVTLPQATKIAVPNIGSMFIGMVKDTSTFTVIGLLELTRATQNLVSQTFEPFTFYTAAALMYVAAAFLIDFLFRAIERAMETPPRGRIAHMLTGRKRRRIGALVERVGASETS